MDHNPGGRDALIISCYANAKRFFPMSGPNITVLSFDSDLLQLKRLKFPGTEVVFSKPFAKGSSWTRVHAVSTLDGFDVEKSVRCQEMPFFSNLSIKHAESSFKSPHFEVIYLP